MPWITTKDGRHVNTDWFDEDEKRKYRQIEANKKEATEKNDSLTQDEEAAIDYWRGGKNGRAYSEIRSIVNGDSKPTSDKEAKLAKDMESAVQKAPTAEGKTLVRVTGDWRIPRQGVPKEGMEFSLGKLESFSSTDPKNYDKLVEKLGQGMEEEIVFRITGTSNFKDISNLGGQTGGTAIEKECLTNSPGIYRIKKVTPVKEEGTWLNPEGKQKYVLVDIEEVKKGNNSL